MPKFLILFIFLTFLNCERDLTNPFDPENDYEYLEVGFYIIQNDSSAILRWYNPEKPSFVAFEIYKSNDGENYELYSTQPRGVDSFRDNNLDPEIKYSYYLKMIGDGVESKRTRAQTIILGPGDIWILDGSTWEILKLNYDLSNYSIRKNGIWFPQDLTIAKSINLGLITYPFYNLFEIFDLNSGQVLVTNNDIPFPYDAAFSEEDNNFWLIDTSGVLYKVDHEASYTVIKTGFREPAQIEIIGQDIIILENGSESVRIYNSVSKEIKTVVLNHLENPFTNLTMIRVDKLNRAVYLLDKAESSDWLYKYDLQTETVNPVFHDNSIRTFDIDSRDESIWIVRYNGLNFDLLQLSNSEERLIDEFYSPRDLRVNPYNGNIIIADAYQKSNVKTDKVFHYKSDELIGSYASYGDPFKVYIE